MFEKVKTDVVNAGRKITVRKDHVVKALIGIGGTILGLVTAKVVSNFVKDDDRDDEEYYEEEVEEIEEDIEDVEETEDSEEEE